MRVVDCVKDSEVAYADAPEVALGALELDDSVGTGMFGKGEDHLIHAPSHLARQGEHVPLGVLCELEPIRHYRPSFRRTSS